MTEGNHISRELASAWRVKHLDPGSIRAVGDHLAACEECRALVSSPDAAAGLAASLTGVGEHLGFAELESLVSGELADDDAVLFLEHLAHCDVCAEELAELRQFAAQRPHPGRGKAVGFAGGLVLAAAALLGWLNPFTRDSGQKVPAPAVTASALTASLMDSGRIIALDATGSLTGLTGAAPEVATLVGAFLKNGQLPPTPAAAGKLGRKREFLLGSATGETPIRSFAPAGAVVPGLTPHFRWIAAPGASRFVVSVFTAEFEPVIVSPELTTHEWVCTAQLKPGVTYSWTVSAIVAAKRIVAPRSPEPEVRFRMATVSENAEWDALRALTPPSDIAQLLVALKLGMYPEAAGVFSRLKRENPDSPALSRLRSGIGEHIE